MKEGEWEKAANIANDIAYGLGNIDYTKEPVFVGMLMAACDLSERLNLTETDERIVTAIKDYFDAIDKCGEIKF